MLLIRWNIGESWSLKISCAFSVPSYHFWILKKFFTFSYRIIFHSKDTLLLVTCIVSLQKIFVSIPQFMSPYITLLFDKVSEAEAIVSTLKKDTTTLDDVINKFKNDLGQKVAPRILFPIVRDMVTKTTGEETNTVYFIPFSFKG